LIVPTALSALGTRSRKPRERFPIRAVLLAAALCLGACATPTPRERFEDAQRLGRDAGFATSTVRTTKLPTVSFVKDGPAAADIVVYLEGDGFAFVTPYLPSEDPTPINPVALKLAMRDARPRIVYIARPCQYVGDLRSTNCQTRDWTTHRYSEDIVQAVNAALDAELRRKPAQAVHLVGFSGGGAVAILLAARRSDVRSIVTVAGNLDHRLHSQIHNLAPLSGSLDPTAVARNIAAIPQIHYVGGDDRVVPRAVGESFVRALPNAACARLEIVAGATHTEPWVERWPAFLARVPECRR
jgi:dienelactone hydrolase